MTGRHPTPEQAERRVIDDLGKAKDKIRELQQVVAWQARVIAAAGIDVAAIIEHEADAACGVSAVNVGDSS